MLLLAAVLCGCSAQDTLTAARERTREYFGDAQIAENEYLRAWAFRWTGTGYNGWQDDCLQAALERLNECGGVLSSTRSTEYSAAILTLTAAGCDARSVGGYDLTAALFDTEFVEKQGINGPIFALIALDSGAYPAPEGVRETLLESILSRRLEDGGFAYSGDRADPDITAMALRALAPYAEQSAVSEAIGTAIDCLSALQQDDGCYASFGTVNSASSAQVVLALAALGLSQDDERFVKNGVSALDALLGYQRPDGSFSYDGQDEASALATTQAYAALCAAECGYTRGGD